MRFCIPEGARRVLGLLAEMGGPTPEGFAQEWLSAEHSVSRQDVAETLAWAERMQYVRIVPGGEENKVVYELDPFLARVLGAGANERSEA